MKKKTAIINFILIIVFALIFAFLTFCSFRIPFTNSNWNSFVRGMNFSGDVKNGLIASYSISYSGDDVNAKDNVRREVYEILNDNYSQPNVYLEGENVLYIETGSNKNFTDSDKIENVLSSIGEKTTFKIYSIFGSDTITIANVTSAYMGQIAGQNALILKFNKEGRDLLNSDAFSSYSYLQLTEDGSPIAKDSGWQVLDEKVYIYGGAKAAITSTLINLSCEKNGVTLTYNATKTLSPTMGENFAFICFLSLIGICLAFFVLMIVKLKFLGAFSVFSLLMFAGIYTLFLNILPNVQINVGSLIGISLSIIVFVVVNFVYANEIKKQYIGGKSAINAAKFAFSGMLKNVVDFSIALIIPMIVLMFVGASSINSFATCFMIGILVSMFTTLIVSKNLFESSITIFGKHQKLIGFSKKEEAKNED